MPDRNLTVILTADTSGLEAALSEADRATERAARPRFFVRLGVGLDRLIHRRSVHYRPFDVPRVGVTDWPEA